MEEKLHEQEQPQEQEEQEEQEQRQLFVDYLLIFLLSDFAASLCCHATATRVQKQNENNKNKPKKETKQNLTKAKILFSPTTSWRRFAAPAPSALLLTSDSDKQLARSLALYPLCSP